MIFVLLLPIIAVSHSGMPPPVPAQEPSESQSLQRVEIVRGWGWQQSKRQWRVAWEQTNLVSLCSRGSWMCKAGHWLNVYAYCNCKTCKFGFAVVHCCATLNYQRESNTFRTTGVSTPVALQFYPENSQAQLDKVRTPQCTLSNRLENLGTIWGINCMWIENQQGHPSLRHFETWLISCEELQN